MTELDDLENYLQMQFDQLDHICKSPSPWIFVCLSAFIDFLSQMEDPHQSNIRQRYINFISKWYPAKYRNFTYRNGNTDLAEQMYVILRSGLVHSFSLTPDPNRPGTSGRWRSLYLAHQASGLKHLGRADKSLGIDAAILIAEEFLQDTKNVAKRLIRKARRNRSLRQNIIYFLTNQPPVAGSEQKYFWR